MTKKQSLGGAFKYSLFTPLPEEMIQFDEHIFQMGWNHQLDLLFYQTWSFVTNQPSKKSHPVWANPSFVAGSYKDPGDVWPLLLLMVQKSGVKTTWDVKNPL